MAENARMSPAPTNIWTRFYIQLNVASSAVLFGIHGAFSSSVSRPFNAAFSALRRCLFYFIRVQYVRSFNESLALIIPVLTTFLQLKYQGNNDQNKTLFVTHPRTLHVAVSSSLAYYLAYIALLRFPLRRRFAVVAHHFLVWSGYASVASLASVLFPDPVSPFVYAIFVSLSAVELMYFLYHELVVEEEEGADFQAYRRQIARFLNNTRRVFANFSGQRPQLLPL